MSALGIAAAVVGSWLVLSVVSATGLALVASALKRLTPHRTYTNLTVGLPEVPDPIAALMDDLPADVLSDAEIAARCQKLEAAFQ